MERQSSLPCSEVPEEEIVKYYFLLIDASDCLAERIWKPSTVRLQSAI